MPCKILDYGTAEEAFLKELKLIVGVIYVANLKFMIFKIEVFLQS